jgi:hypothetical protein
LTEEKKWYGAWPAHCNECGIDLSLCSHFYDVRAECGYSGLICPACKLYLFGIVLGIYRAKKYNSKTLEKLKG